MRLLFVSPFNCVPPNTGNKNLTFNLLKYLVTKIAVDLLIIEDERNLDEHTRGRIEKSLPGLNAVHFFRKPTGRRLREHQARFLSRTYHPVLGRYFSDDAAEYLRTANRAKNYNIVHFDMFHTAAYRACIPDVPAVLVASDAYSLAATRAAKLDADRVNRWRTLLEGWLIRRFEKGVYPSFETVVTVSPVDTRYLRSTVGRGAFSTVGIGIGDEFSSRAIDHFETADAASARILCTGSIDHKVVADGVIEFIRAVAASPSSRPLLSRICVLGKNPTAGLRELFAEFPEIEHVAFAEDYAAFLDQDWVYVYAQRCGSGLQTKLQQAMCAGLPAVGFRLSFDALGAEPGVTAFPCDTMDEIVATTARLVGHAEERLAVGARAAAHIRETFDPHTIGAAMMAIYERLGAPAPPAR